MLIIPFLLHSVFLVGMSFSCTLCGSSEEIRIVACLRGFGGYERCGRFYSLFLGALVLPETIMKLFRIVSVHR